MENATKALLIAGGILIAMMVASLVMISYNGIVRYQQSKKETMSEQQIAKFNKEYEAYNRDNVTGFELVSLINKIASYNALNTVSSDQSDWGNNNTDKSYTEMFIKFTITNDEIKNLYTKEEYNSQKQSDKNELDDIRKKMNDLEKKYGAANMSKYVSMGSDYDQDGESPTKQEVEQYGCYIEFKRANFKCISTEYDQKSGRITKLVFIQK